MKHLEYIIFFIIVLSVMFGGIYFARLDNINNKPIITNNTDTIFIMNVTCYKVTNNKNCNNITACMIPINKLNPISSRIVALSRELLKKYNKNAYFSFGDSIELSGKDFVYAGKYIIGDCTAKSIHNSIDICVGANNKISSWRGIFVKKIKKCIVQ